MEYTPETARLITSVATRQLRQFVRNPEATCQESILLSDGCFCGMRFSSGDFFATWRVGQSQLECFRLGEPILAVDLNQPSGDQSRAA